MVLTQLPTEHPESQQLPGMTQSLWNDPPTLPTRCWCSQENKASLHGNRAQKSHRGHSLQMWNICFGGCHQLSTALGCTQTADRKKMHGMQGLKGTNKAKVTPRKVWEKSDLQATHPPPKSLLHTRRKHQSCPQLWDMDTAPCSNKPACLGAEPCYYLLLKANSSPSSVLFFKEN